jgi:histone H3/H4
LPLARVKKIMKADEDVKMISAEAPVLFAKACEMFIVELTHRSYYHTLENKRKTLQRSDISQTIASTDIYDFLQDIIPKEELREAQANVKKANEEQQMGNDNVVSSNIMHSANQNDIMVGNPPMSIENTPNMQSLDTSMIQNQVQGMSVSNMIKSQVNASNLLTEMDPNNISKPMDAPKQENK